MRGSHLIRSWILTGSGRMKNDDFCCRKILQTVLNSDCQEWFAFIGVRVYTNAFLYMPACARARGATCPLRGGPRARRVRMHAAPCAPCALRDGTGGAHADFNCQEKELDGAFVNSGLAAI